MTRNCGIWRSGWSLCGERFLNYQPMTMAGRAPPHCPDIFQGPERHDDELAGLHMSGLRYQVVVGRWQRQRHQDRYGIRRLCSGLGQGGLFEVS